jgi:transposase InsO family protein
VLAGGRDERCRPLSPLSLRDLLQVRTGPLQRGSASLAPIERGSRPRRTAISGGLISSIRPYPALTVSLPIPRPLCRPHAHEEYHRDGERALKAAMKESQATDRWLGANCPRRDRGCLWRRSDGRGRAVSPRPGRMIAASEATTSTAKIEIRTIPTRVPVMKAPVLAQVIRLGCDGQA